MAEVYRSEMDVYGDGIREREYGYIVHMRDEGLRNDDALLVRDSNTMSRYPLHYLFTESRVNSRSVGEDSLGSVFASHGENHDGLVRRALPSVNVSRNVDAYDDNGDDFEYRGQGRNVSRIPIEDASDIVVRERDGLRFCYEDGSRGLSPHLRSSGHRGLVQGVANEGRYFARESEVLPHFEGELSRRSYGDRNGLSYSPECVSRSLAPRSRSVGQRTTYYEHSGTMIGPENGARSLTPHRQRTPSEEIADYTATEREYPPHRERGIVRQPYDDQSGIRLGHEGGPRSLTPRARSSGQRTPIEGIANERNYPSRMERELSRRLYDDENGLRFSREGRSYSSTPRSNSSGQGTPFQGIIDEVLSQEVQYYRSADAIGSGTRISSSRLSSHIPYSMTDGVSHPLYAEASPNAEYSPSVYRSDDYIDPESRRSTNVSREVVYGDNYEDGHSVQDYYTQEGTIVIDYVNDTLPTHHYVGHSRRDAIDDGHSGLHNISHPHEALTSDNAGVPMVDYEMGQAEVNIGPSNSYQDQRVEDIYGRLPQEEQYFAVRIPHCMSYDGQYTDSPRRNEEALLMDGNTRLIVDPRDLPEQSDAPRTRMRGHISTRDGSFFIAENEGELGVSSRSIRVHDEPHLMVGTSNTDARQLSSRSDRGSVRSRLRYPESVPRSRHPRNPDQQEVRNRDEPSSSHVSHTTTSRSTKSKRKLNRVPKQDVPSSTAPDPDGLESELNVNKKPKVATEDSESKHHALGSKVVDPDFPVFRVKPLEELPEDSMKFKRYVDEWFMKSMAYLNGNICCQKRFRADGTRGPLKCIICSSHVDFAQTKDVATHAFSSPKVGYRALHLGFHQALCVLMGWNSAVASNGRWVCQPLPELVNWSLREDIIIWPPVVIIHKNPAKIDQLNELPNVSEELQNILRDNGFGNYIKACHEKPGNPNVMVVEFLGIVPGFKEAERLHKIFADNKHGRIEIARLDGEVVCCKSLLVDAKPEDNGEKSLLVDANHKVVVKRDSDHNEVDNRTFEQSECKTGENLVNKDNGEKSLDNTQVDQQTSDMCLDDPKHVVVVLGDIKPIVKALDDQAPIVIAQDAQDTIVNAMHNQDPKEDDRADMALDNGEKSLDNTQVDQRTSDMCLDDPKRVVAVLDDIKPIVKALDDQAPIVIAQDAQDTIVNAMHNQDPKEDDRADMALDNGEKSLDNTQVDQRTSDMCLDDPKRVVVVLDDIKPIVKALDDQAPIVIAQDAQDMIVNATHNQDPKENDRADMALDNQGPKITAQNDQASKGTAQNDQDPIVTVQDDHNTIVTAQEDQSPKVTAQDDEGPKVMAQEDLEPIVKAQDDQEPIGLAQEDQERIVTVQDDQEPIIIAQDDQETILSAQKDQASMVMAQIDQERVVTARDDQEPIVTAQKDQESIVTVQVDQESLVKAQGNQEPIATAQVEQEPIDKTKDDSLLVNTSENDQENLSKKECTLYGYLGIIDELNILPSTVIRCHLARSKKGIITSYNAVM